MLHPLNRTEKAFLILVLAALIGWSSLAYSVWSLRNLRQQFGTLTTDHKATLASYQALRSTIGELKDVETKLSAIRTEYIRAAQTASETKTRIAVAQQELGALGKRLEQAKDRANQTGSIRQADPSKIPAR